MAEIKKTNNYCYDVDGFRVYTSNEMWSHTVKRITDAEQKAKNNEDFVKKMVTRLKRIQNKEKVYYAIAVLMERGHKDVVDIYDGKLLMDKLTEEWGSLDF